MYEGHRQSIVSHGCVNTQQAIMPQVALQPCAVSSESFGATIAAAARQELAQQ
jgi:hypothetical protein